jgi:hypothetical protein
MRNIITSEDHSPEEIIFIIKMKNFTDDAELIENLQMRKILFR